MSTRHRRVLLPGAAMDGKRRRVKGQDVPRGRLKFFLEFPRLRSCGFAVFFRRNFRKS